MHYIPVQNRDQKQKQKKKQNMCGYVHGYVEMFYQVIQNVIHVVTSIFNICFSSQKYHVAWLNQSYNIRLHTVIKHKKV